MLPRFALVRVSLASLFLSFFLVACVTIPDELYIEISLAVDNEAQQGARSISALSALNKAKKTGAIGEASDGLLRVRAEEADNILAGLVEEENESRTSDYAARAEKYKVSPETVGELFGKERISKEPEGNWVQTEDGNWSQV